MNQIKLGNKLRDAVTGFTGIATIETEFLTGNIQFNLAAPAQEDGTIKELAFDVFQLEYVAEGVKAIPAPEDTGIKLGEQVTDMVTKVKGIATLKSTFLNGCVYYTVADQNTKDPKETFVEYRRLTKTGTGVIAALKKRAGENSAKTGGPSFKVPMRG